MPPSVDSPVSPAPAVAAPRIIAGRYQTVRALGRGCLGETQLVRLAAEASAPPADPAQTSAGGQRQPPPASGASHAILKILHRDHDAALSPARVSALLALQHPNLAPFVEAGVDEQSGRRFLVAAWVDGVDWGSAARLAGPLEVPRLLAPICRALVHLHEAGACHGRLHAGNVRVRRRGPAQDPQVLLCDFGLVAPAGEGGAARDFRDLGWMLLRALAPEPELPAPGRLDSDPAALEALIDRSVEPHSAPLAYVIRRCLAVADSAPFHSAVEILDEVNRRAGLDLPIHPPELRRSLPFGARLAGRRRELDRLKMRLEAMVGGGLGVPVAPLAILLGESGIGKSRVLKEFMGRAAKRSVRIASGICRETDRRPFAPFAEVVRVLAESLQQQERGEAGVHPLLARYGCELIKICPELRRLPGVAASAALEPEQEKMRLIDQTTCFIHDAARLAPVLIALEDLHGSDGGTLDLLRYLSRGARGGSVHVLATARREDVADSPLRRFLDEGSGEGWLEQIPLERLAEEDLAKLAAEALGMRDPEHTAALQHLARQAEGNPHHLEEILCHLVEQGIATPAAEGWKLDAARLETIPIPRRIAQAFLDRVGRLDPIEIRLLRVLATFGRECAVETLSGMLERPRWEVQRQVEALTDRAILERILLSDGSRYAFRHTRQGQALYETIPEADQPALHARVAAGIKAAGGAADPAMEASLAGHLLLSGSVDEAYQVGLPALEHLLERSAFREALDLALTLGARSPSLPESAVKLLNARANCELWLGDPKSAASLYEQALALAHRNNLEAMAAAANIGLAYVGLWGRDEGARERGLQAAREAYSFLCHTDDLRGLRRILSSWAGYYLSAERLHIAERILDRAERFNPSLPEGPGQVSHLTNRGILMALRGKLKYACTLLERAYSVAERARDSDSIMLIMLNSVFAKHLKGNFKEAECVLLGPELSHARARSVYEAHAEVALAFNLSGKGRFMEACHLLKGMIHRQELPTQRHVPESCKIYLADTLLLLGRLDDSEQCLAALEAEALSKHDAMIEFGVRIWRARLEAARGNADKARSLFETCLARSVRGRNPRYEAQALWELVALQDKRNTESPPDTSVDRLWEIASEGESVEEFIAARIARARQQVKKGEIDAARALLAEAFDEAEQKEARVWSLRVLGEQCRLAPRVAETDYAATVQRLANGRIEEILNSIPDQEGKQAFLRTPLASPYRPTVPAAAPAHSEAMLPTPLGKQTDEPSRAASTPGKGIDSNTAEDDPLIIGRSPLIRRLLGKIAVASRGDVGVLIQGESGSGKELVARRIHQLSSRSGGPFVAVDCGAIPENLIEGELFGYRQGAFTGAERDKPGLFEEADGGTLLLDEIGNAGANFQAKLLRVLQEREVRRIGETRPRSINVRVIAATNADLRVEAEAGAFREDLLYRLSVVVLDVPPLRERREDLPLLAAAFLKEFQTAGQTTGTLSAEAGRALTAHVWPGNVRELRHALQAALLASDGQPVQPEHLPEAVRAPREVPAAVSQPAPPRRVPAGDEDKQKLLDALRQTGGDKTAACRLLGWNRMKLYRRLRQCGIAADFGKPASR